MQKYQDLSAEIKGVKLPIKIMVAVGIGINLVILVVSLWINFFDGQGEKFSSIETCFQGMRSIVNNAPDPELISEKVILDIEKEDIKFSVERIHIVKYLDGLHCDVITKDPQGYRSYLVTLQKNSKFNHFFKITDVKGQKIISRYQR